ncbi:MAG: ATP phosphoribosyltransferase regulatory subunit [Pseudomonadota bacterium]
MASRSETNARAAALRARFEAAGAVVVEPPILQPADTLLDLYGEDIRARAYVTHDPLRGEQMLRPDFTVPVVEMHMAGGAEPARYTYAGEVFRRQEDDPARASEYVQVGFEIFDRHAPAEADAEAFHLISQALAHVNARPVMGDIGILMAAVDGLDTSAPRKAALMRHIWRPHRFRALLDRFAGACAGSETRAAVLAGSVVPGAPLIGLRSKHEIEARITNLREDAEVPPLAASAVAALDALLAVSGPLPQALSALRDLSSQIPAIAAALALLEERALALQARGIAVETLPFEASFGRTLMEYYDGFVFAFHSPYGPDGAPLASGGRYDALTRQLGGGRSIPAVGGVMRPGLLLDVEQGT